MDPILDEQPNKSSANYQPCYYCNTSNPIKVNYSWWGGWTGPKLLHHVKCTVCGKYYNGKTGQPNTQRIFIYFIFTLGIAILFLVIFL